MVQLAPATRLVPQLLANTNWFALVPVTAMLLIVNVVVPELVMVTDCEALEAPTVVEPNAMLVADRVTGTTPVPLKAMVCGDPVALSVIVTAAVIAPAAVGWKCPWMVQFAPTARLVPQVLAKTNWFALVPVIAMLLIVNNALPELVMVTDCEALEAPTVVEPNAMLVAERVTGDAVVTVTETMLDVEEGYVPLPENVAVIEFAPDASAVPATESVQLPELSEQVPSAFVPALNETVPVTAGGVST